jgi:hypothetical protein
MDGGGVVAPPVHVLSRAPLLLATRLSRIIPFPRVFKCVVVRLLLVHTGRGASYPRAHVLHYPLPLQRTACY